MWKINIKHIRISLDKYISEEATDVKFTPDVSHNPSNFHKITTEQKFKLKLFSASQENPFLIPTAFAI